MQIRLLIALVLGGLIAAPTAVPAQEQGESVQRRPARITIYPQNRPLHTNAKRECVAWLEREYRVSRPVIVPRERCWWR